MPPGATGLPVLPANEWSVPAPTPDHGSQLLAEKERGRQNTGDERLDQQATGPRIDVDEQLKRSPLFTSTLAVGGARAEWPKGPPARALCMRPALCRKYRMGSDTFRRCAKVRTCARPAVESLDAIGEGMRRARLSRVLIKHQTVVGTSVDRYRCAPPAGDKGSHKGLAAWDRVKPQYVVVIDPRHCHMWWCWYRIPDARDSGVMRPNLGRLSTFDSPW